MAASATLALKAGVWFRRGRLLIVSPDSLGTACPLSGRNSTYRPVQISGTGSLMRVARARAPRGMGPFSTAASFSHVEIRSHIHLGSHMLLLSPLEDGTPRHQASFKITP